MKTNRVLPAVLCAAVPAVSCLAQTLPNPLESRIDVVQITATRFGEPVQEVPVSMSIVTHDEMVARGANDLRTALNLLGGAGIAPGGDAGPAGVVPGLLGLREADDFLLLIDGVPAGGAFTPPFESISLNNVERIEVLRGAAPVYFGTTAFAGTINIIHYRAGSAAPEFTLTAGSHGSASVSGARALSTGSVKQSLALEISRYKLSDPRAGYDRAQANYRLATEMLGGDFRLDANFQWLHQKPASPTPVGEDGRLTDEGSFDFNQNPADGRLDTRRQQLVLAYDRPLAIGRWGSTLSWTHTHVNAVQGFLIDGGLDLAKGDNAAGAGSSRHWHDLFFDSHITDRPLPWLDLTCGLNELYGRAEQAGQSYTYRVPLDASPPQNLATGTLDETTGLQDRRSLFGLYAQSRIKVSADASLLAGLRWNHTAETRHTTSDGETLLDETQRNSRWSGSVGGLWEVWRDKSGDLDDVALHASVGNTFQPPQLDFGTDAGTQPLLRPETQRSLTFGVKADGYDGRFDVDLAAFVADFGNQAVTSEIDGNPVLRNGGSERYQGFEVETSFRPLPGWTLAGHASYGKARYRKFTTLVGDTATSLDGRFLILTPKVRAGAAVVFAPVRGLGFSLTANYTGARYLDSLNRVQAGGFTTLDASIAYRFERFTLSLAGSNLTNRRDPILPSELGEGQIYGMPGRRVFASLAARFE